MKHRRKIGQLSYIFSRIKILVKLSLTKSSIQNFPAYWEYFCEINGLELLNILGVQTQENFYQGTQFLSG